MSLPARLCCPTSENSLMAKFAGTSKSGSRGTALRGTITPPINQQEEAIDRGFLEEAPARPGG
jgi:hypothetical protein